jgi:hypothetical protein
MRDQSTFLKNCVITIVADDFENFETILKHTKRLAASNGIRTSATQVSEALQSAIADGFVNAYILSPFPPHSTRVEYNKDQLHSLWYYVSPRAKTTVKSIDELSGPSQ